MADLWAVAVFKAGCCLLVLVHPYFTPAATPFQPHCFPFASPLHPCCISDASLLHLFCIPSAPQFHPRCIPASSLLYPCCISILSHLHPSCIPVASQLHPCCIPIPSQLHPCCIAADYYCIPHSILSASLLHPVVCAPSIPPAPAGLSCSRVAATPYGQRREHAAGIYRRRSAEQRNAEVCPIPELTLLHSSPHSDTCGLGAQLNPNPTPLLPKAPPGLQAWGWHWAW